jgi:signal transduction histidine kinase
MRVNLLCNARKLTTRGEVVCSVALAPPAAAPGGAAGDGAGPRSPASGPAASEATGADAAGAAGRRPPMMRFSVADTGAGVDPAEAALLFRPFGQLHRGDSGGTGLGLASVAVRARALGGACGAAPNRPRSSVFWFEIPYVPAEATGGVGDD